MDKLFCEFCGRVIIRKSKYQRFCSSKCRCKAWRILHPRIKKGRKHGPLPIETRLKISNALKGKRLDPERIKRMTIERKGKPHSISPEGLKRLREKLSGKNNYRWKGGNSKCVECGKITTGRECKRCRECFIKWQKANPCRGEKIWSWKGGITPIFKAIRGLPEAKEWKKAVFKRDNYTCQMCGKKNCALHSHHIKPFAKILHEFLQEYSQFSPIEDKETLLRLAMYYKPFWEVENGKTLCKKCHKIVHSTRIAFNSWLFKNAV